MIIYKNLVTPYYKHYLYILSTMKIIKRLSNKYKIISISKLQTILLNNEGRGLKVKYNMISENGSTILTFLFCFY